MNGSDAFLNQCGKSKKPIRVDKCLEFDHQIRECQILLYTTAVKFSYLNSFLMGNRGIYRQEWHLVAHFQSPVERLMTFETCVGQDGRIEAYRIDGSTPKDAVERLLIGTVRTSPKELLLLAQKHPYNGTNAPILASFQKCQDWFNQFARMISPSINLP